LDAQTDSLDDPRGLAREMPPAMRSEDASRLSRATVLLVDEDPALAEGVRAMLGAPPQRLVAATSPDQVQALLEAHDPDVLLLGTRTPAHEGLEVLAALRASERWQDLPVVMLIAADDADARKRALALDASDFLAVPVDAAELQLRLRNALGFKAYRDRLLRRDPLTGLPNRAEFMRRVQSVLGSAAEAAGGDAARSLVVLDIDRFKQVNDGLGHAAGDALLLAVAQRLEQAVARHGGGNRRADGSGVTPWLARTDRDRFLALLPGAPGSAPQEAALAAIVEGLERPFHLERREFHLSASMGLAGFPGDGDSAETLMQRAEIALLHAKKRGGKSVAQFGSEMLSRANERLTLENQLHYAIRRDELRLHYQPKVDCAALRMVGVESLIRWQHPDHGLLAPHRFIPLAEEAGLIDSIGEWAIREACRQGAAWLSDGLPPLDIAVNLSAAQLLRGDFPGTVARALADSGFPARRLTLELTESMLMKAGEQGDRTLAAVKALGVALSLDDFGTGYSSLSYLQRFPVREVKIDRSFVRGLSDPAGAHTAEALIRSIIGLGESLRLNVVAEGVEDAATLVKLQQFGCDVAQGYFIGRPAPADQLHIAAPTQRSSEWPRAVGE
jgi:diguanylate cyclase (GGDEF)-like protein